MRRERGRQIGRHAVRSLGNPRRAILTMTDGTIVALVTTAAPHGLTTGDIVKIGGTGVDGYDLTGAVTVVSATTFTADAVEYTADSKGGHFYKL